MLLFAAILGGTGCQKPENDLGLDLIDPNDTMGLLEIDTASLLTYTLAEDPVRTSGLSRNALGSYVDPDFGLVKASIVTQVRLSTSSVGAGQDNHALVADSLVLALVFDLGSYAYGNLHPQRLKVYEVGQDLVSDSIYRTDNSPGLLQVNDLVETTRRTFTPDPFHTVIVAGDTLRPQLRIPLSGQLADRLLHAWGTSDLTDNTTFLQFFKGFWIVPDNDPQGLYEGGVWYFNLLDAQSKLTLYYRNTAPGSEDTLAYDFSINENCVRYTRCEHDFSLATNAALPSSLADTTLGLETVFVQSFAGTRTGIAIPALESFIPVGLNAVAKAELVIPVADAFYPYYQPPAQLFVFRKGDDGQDLFLPDQLTGNIGGTYDPTAREYRLNITRWTQDVLNGTYENTGLFLVASSNGVSANRVVLGGAQHAEHPMRLLLTFTTY